MNFYKQVEELKTRAIEILYRNGNFVHNVNHICNVYQNAMTLQREASVSLGVQGLAALRLAIYWHDTGRLDREEKEIEPHEKRSARLLAAAAEVVELDQQVVNAATRMILVHRNRRATQAIAAEDLGARVLWDADKLDIFNPSRCEDILAAYEAGIQCGEFCLEESTRFWFSLQADFQAKFHFAWSKMEFSRRFVSFSEWRSQRLSQEALH